MNGVKMHKYELILLDIIGHYNHGNGIGTPTLDRLFYKRLSKEPDLSDIFSISWLSLVQTLTEKDLIQRVPSGKGEMITHKGKMLLEMQNQGVSEIKGD